MDSKISVVIQTYNAREHLREVLESVRGFDEVVVCDMESTDDTLDIAREYGCKIVTFPRGEHRICEPARDFAIHSASNKWVLVVDADEVVPSTLRDYLYGKIADKGFQDALLVPRINRFMGAPATASPDYQLRFFQQEKAYWPPVIHARPEIQGNISKIPFKKEFSFIHLDDAPMSKRIAKMNAYTDYEVPKRKDKKFGIVKMMFRPFWFFFRTLVIGGGYKDGYRGFARSYMSALYQMMQIIKLNEQNRPLKKKEN